MALGLSACARQALNARDAMPDAERLNSTVSHGAALHILLVEDNVSGQWAGQKTLEQAGSVNHGGRKSVY